MDLRSNRFHVPQMQKRWPDWVGHDHKRGEGRRQRVLAGISKLLVLGTLGLRLVGGMGAGLFLSPSFAFGSNRNLEDKITLTQWANVRGVNFIPSYASNTFEIWRNYDHDLFDRELRLASVVGYNSIRLWLNYAAYEELGSKMVDNVEDALRLCAKHHLRAVVVLFDSCGIRPRKDTQWMTAREAYDQFQASPRFTGDQKLMMRRLFENYVHGFGANTLVPVAADSPMMVLLWGNWQPNPGNDHLGPDWYSRLQQYVDAVMGRLKDNPNVLLWDLMNEPEFASEGPISPSLFITPEMKKVRDAFLERFHDYIKQRYPDEIVSVGWGGLENAEEYSNLADVVTFHVYGGPERIESEIDKAQAFGKSSGKTVLITETLANWDFGSPDFGRLATDEQQLAHYQKVLPVLVKSPIGWIGWGLVISHDFDPFTDIFYPDGHPRPAARFLEKMLKGTETPAPRQAAQSDPDFFGIHTARLDGWEFTKTLSDRHQAGDLVGVSVTRAPEKKSN